MGGATLPRKNYRKTYLNFRNNFILLFKNLPSKDLLRVISARIFLDMVSAVFFLLKFEFGECYAVVRAQFSVLRRAGSIINKRRETRKLITGYSTGLLYPRSIVYLFFFKRIKTYRELESLD